MQSSANYKVKKMIKLKMFTIAFHYKFFQKMRCGTSVKQKKWIILNLSLKIILKITFYLESISFSPMKTGSHSLICSCLSRRTLFNKIMKNESIYNFQYKSKQKTKATKICSEITIKHDLDFFPARIIQQRVTKSI